MTDIHPDTNPTADPATDPSTDAARVRAACEALAGAGADSTVTAVAAEARDNLTQALDAVAAKVRRQEEEIRALKRRETTPTTRPTRKQTAD